ncbi:MAG: M43 family zinc metalloprotease [Flavobacterium sp. JAD_PAG50586_2]|nr:MAG: M43 family zinc metalloprotease [Flavobacterium sp. JAD_PAG50586_2]
MKKIFILLLMFLGLTVHSQTPCFTDQVTTDLINTDPDVKIKIDNLDSYLADRISLKTDIVPSITIPVQINILHNNQALGGGANINDSQVLDQLVALNNYYSAYGISFCLATKTGANPIVTPAWAIQNTPGIIHYNTTATDHTANASGWQSLLDAIHPTITRSQYLRIWVVNSINGTSSGILGYSMFPNTSPVFDGIVMRYDTFGNGNANLRPNYNLGKTLVHEVGHYLGLYHTFEGGCAGMTGSNCLSAGDRVCDTPPVAAANFSCTTGTNSCSESPNFPDLINNYMDYGNDNCVTSFTLGQKWRMYDAVNFARRELISDENLIYTGVTCINPNTITAKFTPSTYYSCFAGNSITFTPLLNSTSLTYSWDFGDTASGASNQSLATTPTHSFTSAANSPYTVSLTVSDGTNSATYLARIFITNCSGISGQESTWYFSTNNSMSFSTGVPIATNKTFPQAVTFDESCAMVNNSSGGVLFYTNGRYVWKDSINAPVNSTALTGSGNSKSGVLILPNPANSIQYYIFTIDSNYSGTGSAGLNGFRYSLVNVSGGIVSMAPSVNVPITIPAGFNTGNNGAVLGGEGVIAMERCTGGYWIFTTLKSSTGKYIVIYSLTTSGLAVVSSTFLMPTSPDPLFDWRSSLKISPDGNKLLYVNYHYLNNSYLFDFNKFNGTISNTVTLPKCSGACFSPDSKLLYMDSGPNRHESPDTIYLYQYNMNSSNIINSRVTVASNYGNTSEIQIGPDNKLYQCIRNKNRLGIVHNPNTLASTDNPNACNYTVDGLITNTEVYNALPNFINAKTATAFPTTASISSYPSSCLAYKFVANACGTTFNWEIRNSSSAIIFTGSGTQITYTFPSTGSYTIYLKSSTNTALANIPLVIANPVPVIAGGTSICPVGSGHRNTNNSVTLLTGQTVVWSVSGTGTIVGLNNQSSVEVTWASPGTLTATITNASGCSGSASVNITQQSAPSTPVISGSTYACVTETSTTTNTTTIPLGHTALWTVTGGTYSSFTGAKSATANITWTSLPGQITLTLTNSSGCSSSVTQTITSSCQCDCLAGFTKVTTFPQTCAVNNNTDPFCQNLSLKYIFIYSNATAFYTTSNCNIPKFGRTITGVQINILDSSSEVVCSRLIGFAPKTASISTNEITVSPNPSKGLFTVNIKNFNDKVSVKVLDLNGRVVYKENQVLFDSAKTIDLSNLQKGVYLLKLSGKDLNSSLKIVKD